MSLASLQTVKRRVRPTPALIAAILLAVVAPVSPTASAHQRGDQHDAASVLSWNAPAADALAVDAEFGPPVFAVGIAYVQAAVYNAVVGIEGGFRQYKWHARAHRGTSVDAAVAAAAHRILLTHAPAAHVRVDAAYTAALDAIADGWAKDAGIRFGERAAAHIVALSTGDGWMAAVPFTQAPVHPHGIAWAARYLAGADLAAGDAAIAAGTRSFVYASWRPVTAIQLADTDGNPATTADPTWAPLIVTPNHPDYLSGHTTVSGAVATALTRLTGTSRIDLNMPSPTNASVQTRHYEWAGQLNAESIGARVWAGIHTRTADEVGNRVGKKVGAFGLNHYFAPTG